MRNAKETIQVSDKMIAPIGYINAIGPGENKPERVSRCCFVLSRVRAKAKAFRIIPCQHVASDASRV